MLAPLVAVALCGGLSGVGGCIAQGNSFDASADQSAVMPGPDAGTEDDASDAPASLTSAMRIANMSPNLGPVDFCWRVTGSGAFTGPVLGGSLDAGSPPMFDAAPESGEEDAPFDGGAEDAEEDARFDAGGDGPADTGADVAESDAEAQEAGDGAAPGDAGARASDAGLDASDAGEASQGDAASDAGVAGGGQLADGGAAMRVDFGQASEVVTLPAIGTLDIALVAPYQLSCASPRFIGRVTLDPGKVATVVVMGEKGVEAGGSALQIKAFIDDPPGKAAQVRVIHTALGGPGEPPSPALGVEAAGVPLAPEVEPGQASAASTSPSVDTLGYAPTPVLPGPAPIEITTLGDAAARTWTTPFFDQGLLAGTSHTAFVVTLAAGSLGIVWCEDAFVASPAAPCLIEPAR